jgi:hypothetical protein
MGRHTHKTKPTCDQINFSDVFYYRYLIIFHHIYCIMFHIYAQGTIFRRVTKVTASWSQLSKHDQWGISTKVAITNHSYLELLSLISFGILDFIKNISPCGCYLWQRECSHPIAIKRQHQGSDPFSSARCRDRRVIDGTHLWSHPHGDDEKVRMQWFKHITPRGFAWNLVPMPIWQLQVSQASWARNVTKAHIRMVLGLEWSWSFPKGTGF